MANRNKVPEFLKMATDLKRNAARYAGSESVKFFKESFVKEGFTDSSFKSWTKTTNPMAGKRTLYKSGTLMQSIRKTEESMEKVIVISDTKYSEIHNEGGSITVTKKMKRFFWAKYYDFKDRDSKKADFCKKMALRKEGSKINIPQHKFMGESKTMMNTFESFFKGQVDIVFKQHLNE